MATAEKISCLAAITDDTLLFLGRSSMDVVIRTVIRTTTVTIPAGVSLKTFSSQLFTVGKAKNDIKKPPYKERGLQYASLRRYYPDQVMRDRR